MSSHEITHAGEHLEFLHKKITTAISEVIKQNPFNFANARLELDCAEFARTVYRKMPNSISNLDDLVKGTGSFKTFGAYPPKDKALADSIKKIHAQLLQHLDNMPQPIARILKSRTEMSDGNNIFAINDKFIPFQRKKGLMQPVSTGENKSGEKLLRAHLCKVSMTASSQLLDNIKESIDNRYQSLVDKTDNISKSEVLADIKSQLKQLFEDRENPAIIGLCDLLDKESAGLIKREAGISYLEYLLKNAKRQNIDCRALEKIVNNIRLVENYIYAQSENNEECMYQITENHACDLRELLGNAYAFSELPVIGSIDGNLEERSSDEEQVLVFGIRFKANNPISKPDDDFPQQLPSNQNVYARHLGKAIIVLELAKQFNTATGDENVDYKKLNNVLIGKAIKTVFLYYMVFSKSTPSKSNQPDDKTRKWQAIATKLHACDKDALDALIELANNMLKAEQVVTNTTITPAIELLKRLLTDKKFTGTQSEMDKQRFLVLDKHLVNAELGDAIDGNILTELSKAISQKKGLKQCLRYVRIVKEQKDIPTDSLYSTDFPIYLDFHDTFFYADKIDKRHIEINTRIQPDEIFLPILVAPEIQKTDIAGKVGEVQYNALLNKAGLKITFGHCVLKKASEKANLAIFICKITMAIIFQLALSALCEKLKNQGYRFAIPIVRIHSGDDNQDEKYFKSVCAGITFLLNEKYTIGMQGIQLINFKGTSKDLTYRITNARSSLYAFLPKTILAPQFALAFNKLAIIIVSSRVAGEARNQEDDRLSNIFGRVVMLERLDENFIQINTHFRTFAHNDYQREIRQGNLKVLLDTVRHLYDEHEVRDILYIAKSPFTSHLHLTGKGTLQQAFFMSETLLQAMRQERTDLNIYPTFCEKYPARMLKKASLNTIYIDDVSSIQKHVQMDKEGHSQIVTFLNIANGISLPPRKGEPDKNFFNNIMSYATLGNIYTDRTLQSRIMERLIAPNTPSRTTLIDFICLLHAAAYEKKETGNQVALKLNPYQDILEQDNVNNLGTFPVTFPRGNQVKFNLFSFMTKIQGILNLNI